MLQSKWTIDEVANAYHISSRTVDRYLQWVKKRFQAKPQLDRIIRTMQVIIKDAEREIHNMPEKSGARFTGMIVQLKSLMNLGELLGYRKGNVNIEPAAKAMPRGPLIILGHRE
jgi:hypothetical protein